MILGLKRDYTFHILGIFIILIFTSLFITLHISQTTKNNYDYLNNLKKLELLNKDIDIILSRELEYVSDEKIGEIRYEIEKNLQNLNGYISFLKNGELNLKLKTLISGFRTKSHLLSWFQFHNDRIVNNIKRLIKIQKSLNGRDDLQKLNLNLNGFLINLLYLTHKRDETLNLNLNNLEKLYGNFKKNIPELRDFIEKAKYTVADLEQIKYINRQSKELSIIDKIGDFENSLIKYYTKSQKNQKLISYMLIVFSLLFLLIIIMVYKTNKVINSSLLKFKNAVEESFNSVLITDTDINIIYVNPTFTQITGYKPKEVIGKNPRILKSDIMDQQFYKQMYEKITKGKKWIGMFINKKKNGEIFYEQTSISPILNNGKIDGYLAIKLDITDLVEQTNKLKTAQKITHIGGIEIDWEKNTVELSEELRNILKISQESISYENFISFIDQKERDKFDAFLKNSIKLKNNLFFEHKIIDTKKNIRYVISRFNHRYRSDGLVRLSIGTIQDVTTITKSKERIRYMAYHDLLTNLLNKEGFLEEIKTVIKISENKEDIALLSIDLDKFKDINETLGHETGDELLKIVSKRVKNVINSESIIARFGGDEFFILLKGYDDIDFTCKEILSKISAPIKIRNYTIHITASIGVALYPKNGKNGRDLLKNSDAAMFEAKEEGRNRYKLYTPEISKKIDERLMIENGLKDAIENNEFKILYQPQISNVTDKIVGVEALLRWESKSLGRISPSKFMPIAEDSGQIIEIGRWVFENACKEFKKWKQAGMVLNYISINISSIQLEQNDFVNDIKTILKSTDTKASDIELEITERFLVEDSDKNIKILKELKDTGFKISIDDFGTGYSSLNYLRKFPIDTLKIDKSFIKEITSSKENLAIVEAIIALSKNLKYKVVIEGVESTDQKEILQKSGNILFQGNLFSEPINSEEFMEFYNAMRS